MLPRKTKLPEPKEELIEESILQWIEYRLRIKAVWKNDISGYFSKKHDVYFKKKSKYIRRGISDISFLYKGQFVAIEIKRPSEMKFFMQPMTDLKIKYAKSIMLKKKTADKYLHAIEQQTFLYQIREEGGIAFFASSCDQVQKKLSMQGFKY